MSTKSLFQTIKEAGIPFDNHESDLYVPDTPQVREILEQSCFSTLKPEWFINQAPPHKGETWVDIPFAYEPFWERKQQKS